MLVKVSVFCRSCALLAGMLLVFAGCPSGPPKPIVGTVSGKVTLDGAGFSEGRLLFRGRKEGIGAAVELKPDGSYQVKTPEGGLRVDTYDVAIEIPQPPILEPSDVAKGVVQKPIATKVPKKYQDFSTSGLNLTVKEGANTGDFAMTTK